MGMDMWLFKTKKKEEVKNPRDCWDWNSGVNFKIFEEILICLGNLK